MHHCLFNPREMIITYMHEGKNDGIQVLGDGVHDQFDDRLVCVGCIQRNKVDEFLRLPHDPSFYRNDWLKCREFDRCCEQDRCVIQLEVYLVSWWQRSGVRCVDTSRICALEVL